MKTIINLIDKKQRKSPYSIGMTSAYLFFPDGNEITIFGYNDQVFDRLDHYNNFRYLLNVVHWQKGPRYSYWTIHIENQPRYIYLEFKSPKEMYTINKEDGFTLEKFIPNKERKWCLGYKIYRPMKDKFEVLFKIRRIPRKWIPQFDKVVDEYNKIPF